MRMGMTPGMSMLVHVNMRLAVCMWIYVFMLVTLHMHITPCGRRAGRSPR